MIAMNQDRILGYRKRDIVVLAEPAFVTLRIFDIRGRLVRTIEVGYQEAGAYTTRQQSVYWDGQNDFGERVSSGVYLYQLQVGNRTFTRRLTVLYEFVFYKFDKLPKSLRLRKFGDALITF